MSTSQSQPDETTAPEAEAPTPAPEAGDEASTPSAAKAVKKASAKANPKRPTPRAPKPVKPTALAGKRPRPVKVPVVADVSDEELAAAAAFAVVEDGVVFLPDGDTRHEVGPAAEGDAPAAAYAKRFFEHRARLERFTARLTSADMTVRDIDSTLGKLTRVLDKPDFVGDIEALRVAVGGVSETAKGIRAALDAQHAEAREAAVAARETVVAEAEAIAAKPLAKVHWKQDTARVRELLDSWKAAQKDGPRIPKDVEKALWTRFAAARSSFEKQRRSHFATLDKENASVASTKEELVKKAEKLAESTDWDGTARAFKDLMGEWKRAGRGRRSTDDALWKKFSGAQESFFSSLRAAQDAEDAEFAANLPAKEAIVAEAEKLVPFKNKDLQATKQALRALQDRFDAAGKVPRGDVQPLNKRMAAVERAVREAEEKAWKSHNPEVEARVSGAAAQLIASIAELDEQLAAAEKAGDKREVKELTEARAARQAWLDTIQQG